VSQGFAELFINVTNQNSSESKVNDYKLEPQPHNKKYNPTFTFNVQA
jgi:hypothetical protein